MEAFTISLSEEFDLRVAKWLFDNLDLIEPKQNMRPFSGESREHYRRWYANLLRYGKKTGDSIKITVKYHRVHGEVRGRLLCQNSLGLQMLDRRYRHTLAQGRYLDLDIVNCHPVLLEQLCQRNEIPCRALSHYVQHRRECLEEVVRRNPEVKEEFVKTSVILGLINGGECGYTSLRNKPEWLTDFYGCITNIREQIDLKHPELLGFVAEYNRKKGKKYNMMGSVMAKLLQEYEDHCLQAMYDFFRKNNYQPNVLCFDGLMLLDDSTRPVTPELLRRCEEHVELITKFKIKLSGKELKEAVLIPEEQLNEIAEELNPRREAPSEEEVLDHFDWEDPVTINDLFQESGKICTVTHESILRRTVRWNGVNFVVKHPNREVHTSKDLEAKGFCLYDQPEGKGRKNRINLAQFFQDKGGALVCDKILLFPKEETDSPKVFTTWKGWSVKPLANRPRIQRLLEHIRLVWCNNDPAVYRYTMRWLADIFQHPGRTIGTILLFQGDEGTGKSILAELLLAPIMEEYIAVFCGLEPMMQNFNSYLTGKILCILEELRNRDKNTKDDNLDSLKYFITARKILSTAKFCNSEFTSNSANLLAFTNHFNALPQKIGMKRRSMVQEVGDLFKGKTEYFEELANDCSDPEIRSAFLDHLLNYESEEGHPRVDLRKIPMTDAKRRSIGLNLDYHTKLAIYLKYRCEKEVTLGQLEGETRGRFFSTQALKGFYSKLFFKQPSNNGLNMRLIKLGFLKETEGHNNKGLILPTNLNLKLDEGVYEMITAEIEEEGESCLI